MDRAGAAELLAKIGETWHEGMRASMLTDDELDGIVSSDEED
jgi:hypothetical protein